MERDPSTVAEAAVVLRRILAAVEDGEVVADTPKGRALQRRLEGAAVAWEEISQTGETELIPGER